MDSKLRLLMNTDDIELPEIKTTPNCGTPESAKSVKFNKKFEFSKIFWEDETLRRKKKLIKEYKAKNRKEFSNVLKSDYSIILPNSCNENEVKRVFWRTLLTKPLELEIFQSIKNELFFPNNEAEFIYLTNIALNQDFFCNFHQIMSNNRIVPRKDIDLVISYIESYIFCQLGIKNFSQFLVKNPEDNFQINVLKYIVYFEKVDVEKQRRLLSKFLALEPKPVFQEYFQMLLGILNENSEPYNEKFDEYVDICTFKYSSKETESVLTADCNLIVLKSFASELENVLESIIRKPSVDLNRIMVPHGYFKSEIPLVFYVAERGHNELLKEIFESKKDMETIFRDFKGLEISLLTFCIRGFKFYRRLSVRTDISTDFDDCIDLILKHLTREQIFYKNHNPMAEAMRYNYDNAAVKLIQKFGLPFQFVQVMNTRVLKKYLDIHVYNNKAGIAVSYKFLKDETIKNIMRKLDLKTSIQHPVIANYIELKYSQFWPLHVTDLFLFMIFSITFPTLYFFLRHKSSNYDYLLYSSIFYSLFRFGLQISVFYHCLLIPNLSRFSCQSPSTTLQSPLKRSRIFSGLTETFILFLLMCVLFSHLFTNRPEYLFSGSLLLMTIEMTKMLSRISPSNVSKYILMFKTVAITLSITLVIFFWIIVAFTLAFHVVFYVQHPEEISKLDNFWMSFTTTMTIFMGGHDGQALKFNGWWNLMLFALFVLTAISLYNLAMDLAMENAKELRDNGDFVSLEKQFDTIIEYAEFFKAGSRSINRIIYTRKPDEATIIEEIIWRVNRSILNRLKTFDKHSPNYTDTVQITRTRYDALNLIIKSNEEQLIRIDNDVKIDEIEKTVHQIEDSNIRLEHKLKTLRQENDIRREQLNHIKIATNQLESKFNMFSQDYKYRNEQLNRILEELEHLNRQMNEMKISSGNRVS